MGDALSALEQIYFSIQSNLNDMLAACKTQAQRDKVMSQYIAARQNYWQCVNKAFHDDDPELQAIVAEAKTDITALQGIDDNLGKIAKVISMLTQAVDIGSKIAAKVISV
jgi:hypothetical protein